MQVSLKRFWLITTVCLMAVEGGGCASFFGRNEVESESYELQQYQNAKTGVFAVPLEPPGYWGTMPPPPGYPEQP